MLGVSRTIDALFTTVIVIDVELSPFSTLPQYCFWFSAYKQSTQSLPDRHHSVQRQIFFHPHHQKQR